MFVNKRLTYLTSVYLMMKYLTYYFHMKTKILADFQTCIRVPLMPLIWMLYSESTSLIKLTVFIKESQELFILTILHPLIKKIIF